MTAIKLASSVQCIAVDRRTFHVVFWLYWLTGTQSALFSCAGEIMYPGSFRLWLVWGRGVFYLPVCLLFYWFSYFCTETFWCWSFYWWSLCGLFTICWWHNASVSLPNCHANGCSIFVPRRRIYLIYHLTLWNRLLSGLAHSTSMSVLLWF